MQATVGLLGLGTMGKSLARNIQSHGFSVAVYNRTTEKMEEFVEEFGGEKMLGYAELSDFVAALERPRKVIVMVPSGAVDKVLDQLAELLEDGDMVMDGGNSNYVETEEREKRLAAKGIRLLGCGISGGEEGALRGPSLMPGGESAVYDVFAPILEAIAAKDFQGQPCVTYLGKGGAGHYVKMVHNGIEYAIMQLLVEVYQCLRYGMQLEFPEMQAIIKQYNSGKNESFLLGLLVDILGKKDDQGKEGYLLDSILDSAGQKGTGRWTAIEALQLGVPLNIIYAAVDARNLSAQLDLRRQYGEDYFQVAKNWFTPEVQAKFVKILEDVFYEAQILTFAQGFDLLKAAASEYGYGYDLAEVARIWQGGCIIRAQMLNLFKQAWGEKVSHLLESESVCKQIYADTSGTFYDLATEFPEPIWSTFAAAAYYLQTLESKPAGAEVLQALRDYFGAHTYKRVDMEGTFHSDWQS